MTMLFAKEEMRSRWILKSVLGSLKHLGIGPFDGKVGMSGQGVYRLLLRALLFVWLARCGLVLAFNIGKGETMKRAMDLAKILGCLVFHWKFSQHQEAISELLDTMDTLRHDFLSGDRLFKISKFSILMMWTFESVRVPSDYVSFIVEQRYDSFVARDLLLKPEDLSDSAAPVVHIIAIFVFFIERVLLSGTMSSVVLFFSFINIVVFQLCEMSTLSIHKFNRYDFLMTEMLKGGNMNQSAEMRKLRLTHADLCLLVEKIDDIFSTMVFALHMLTTLQLCIEVDKFLVMSASGHRTTFALYNWAFDAIFATSLLLVLLFSSAFVCQSPTGSLPTTNQFGLRDNNEYFEDQLELTQSQMGVVDVGITAGKFYKMDRGTFITSLGLIASYVVFSMQMPELTGES